MRRMCRGESGTSWQYLPRSQLLSTYTLPIRIRSIFAAFPGPSRQARRCSLCDTLRPMPTSPPIQISICIRTLCMYRNTYRHPPTDGDIRPAPPPRQPRSPRTKQAFASSQPHPRASQIRLAWSLARRDVCKHRRLTRVCRIPHYIHFSAARTLPASCGPPPPGRGPRCSPAHVADRGLPRWRLPLQPASQPAGRDLSQSRNPHRKMEWA